MNSARVGTLCLVLGDQLDRNSSVLSELKPSTDRVLMIEALAESLHVPSHKQRTIFFLAAMRHFAEELRRDGIAVEYVALEDPSNSGSLASELIRACKALKPKRILCVEPGEHRVRRELLAAADSLSIPLDFSPDEHFLTTTEDFNRWAKGRKSLTMEYFYRSQRQRLKILVDAEGEPELGRWNYDEDNRQTFGKQGPSPRPKPPMTFEPDAITRTVIALVEKRLPRNPGRTASFAYPVTRADARCALKDFITNRLPLFGPYEDAMWSDEPHLYHSVLSGVLNAKLLNPLECVDAALDAYRRGKAPLQSVEAFIRQIIGWREFIRGVYNREGPTYENRNGLGQFGSLPSFFWNGETDMACVRACVSQVVDRAYGHHIQRLMVLGNFLLTAGVHPRAVSDWFLAMYIDAIDWVTLPNALGMVMHADGTDTSGPVVGTKPYCASGQYVNKMSNYCKGCRYDPALRTGERACPLTVFYWDFLARHHTSLKRNPRMGPVITHIDRMSREQLVEISVSAGRLRKDFGVGDIATPRPYVPETNADYSVPSVSGSRGDTLF